MSLDLHLYGLCAADIKYLLAQSPDTEHLVSDVKEAEWEVVGTKKDVKVSIRRLGLLCTSREGGTYAMSTTSCSSPSRHAAFALRCLRWISRPAAASVQ